MVTLATAITAAIRDITGTAAMPRRITAAMPPLIMAGTLRITTAAMHQCIPAIDNVGLFVRHTPIMAAPGMLSGITATIGTGELRKPVAKSTQLPAARKRAAGFGYQGVRAPRVLAARR